MDIASASAAGDRSPLRRQGQPADPAETPLQSKGVACPADFDVVGAASYTCA